MNSFKKKVYQLKNYKLNFIELYNIITIRPPYNHLISFIKISDYIEV